MLREKKKKKRMKQKKTVALKNCIDDRSLLQAVEKERKVGDKDDLGGLKQQKRKDICFKKAST